MHRCGLQRWAFFAFYLCRVNPQTAGGLAIVREDLPTREERQNTAQKKRRGVVGSVVEQGEQLRTQHALKRIDALDALGRH